MIEYILYDACKKEFNDSQLFLFFIFNYKIIIKILKQKTYYSK